MLLPKSNPPAAYSCVCPSGGVRYFFRTDTSAFGTNDPTTPNNLSCRAAIALEPSGQTREHEYIDIDGEED